MTNGEKYKTAQERAEAFRKYCGKMHDRPGGSCDKQEMCSICSLKWLDLDAEEEKPLPCVYCKGEVKCYRIKEGDYCICSECGATAPIQPTRELAIEMYNRVAKAVKESEAK